MKNTIFILLLLCVNLLHAQIPDSLEVELPWNTVQLADCTNTMGEEPRSEKEGVFIVLESDVSNYDDDGECELRIRSWVILDWFSGGTYNYTQIGQPSSNASMTCENELYFNFDEYPIVLTAEDVVVDFDPTHDYSFSYNDHHDDDFLIDSSSPNNLELYIYDYTANTICRTSVFITHCEEAVDLVFPETAEIVFNGEPYIELTSDMLGVEIDYPCDTYTTEIRVRSQSNAVLFSGDVGKVVNVTVKLKIDNGTTYNKKIDVHVTGIKPDPIAMYIEEKTFSAGETFELEIWSEGIPGLVAWQLQLMFENVRVLEIKNSALFTDVPHNIMNDGDLVRTLWTPADGLPLDADFNATWFTIVVESDIDGETLDIFNTENDPWSLIAVEGDDYIFEFEAEFNFNVAPRNILSSITTTDISQVNVYPNPLNNLITIDGLPQTNAPVEIEIYDLQGRCNEKMKFQQLETQHVLDLSNLPSGMFLLKIQNQDFLHTQKITKM